MWLLALILGLPLIEISLYVTVGAWLGLWLTLAIVIGTAVFGIWLIRSQGERAQRDLKMALKTRSNPAQALALDVLTVVAGTLLVLPGFFTDVCGIVLLLPPVRRAVMRLAQRRAKAAVTAHLYSAAKAAASGMAPARPRPDEVIDTTWEEVPADSGKPPSSGWTRH
ncbi:MAG: FxsA family protein [Rhodobacter sp.]|nr:FxsA family protein [Rhodobacter sp.]